EDECSLILVRLTATQLEILEIRMNGERGVRDERPRRRRPHEDATAGVTSDALKLQCDVDARILDILVPLRDLVARQSRSAARAIRKNLVATRQQLLVEQRLERPPHALDVIVRVG